MPPRTPKACRYRGCRHTTIDPNGYCTAHKGEGWKRHGKGLTAHERGYGSDWRGLRNQTIKRDKGLCQTCRREGVIRVGTSVDHILPKAQGGTDAPDNLECICTAHHRAKTARERFR